MTVKDNTSGLQSIIKDHRSGQVTHIPVPLKSVDISARLINYIAEVTVKQTYVNSEAQPIECEYMFPVEEEAAVIGFKAELEGVTLVSQVKKDEDAEKDYKEAKDEGRTGFLAQAVRQDILQIQVGHLSPGEKCTISITYMVEAAHDSGKIRLTIPTTVAPKFVPEHDHTIAAHKIETMLHTFESPAPLTFHGELLMKTKINEVESPSHDIKVHYNENFLGKEKQCKNGMHKAKVDLKTGALDRDIILLVNCQIAGHSQVLCERGTESTVLMASLVPHIELQSEQALDIVFMVDCSGSMGGNSIKMARDAMNIMLNSLPSSSYFNIVKFGSRHKRIFGKSKPYSDESLAMARNAVKNMEADLGGTNILQPLKIFLKEKTKVPRRIFVLTDGSVSNSQECIKIAQRHNKRVKVFTLGIGASADRHLVKGLARAGMGTSEFTVQGEMITPKVIKQLKHSQQPNLDDVKIDWGVQVESEKTGTQAPAEVPALYNGTRTQVFKLFDSKTSIPSKVIITADPDYKQEVQVNSSELEGELLHKMFARKVIQDFEEQEFIEEKANVKDIIIELALKYQLISRYTSMVAVGTKKRKSKTAMLKRVIPSTTPRGHGKGQESSVPSSGEDEDVAVEFRQKKGPREVPVFYQVYETDGHNTGSDTDEDEFNLYEDDATCDSEYEPRFYRGDKDDDDLEKSPGEMEPIDKVLALISSQSADGQFAKDKRIVRVLELKEEEVDQLVLNNSEGVVYTLLVVLALELRFQELKSSWELVVDKANQALENTGGDGVHVRTAIVKMLQGTINKGTRESLV